MTVGERIRQRRKDLNLTQEELAKRLGCGKSAVCRVEKEDNNITTDRITKYAIALETTPSYLMGWTNPSTGEIIVSIEDDMGIEVETAFSINNQDKAFKYRLSKYIEYIAKRQSLQELVDASINCSDEDIKIATQLLERLNKEVQT